MCVCVEVFSGSAQDLAFMNGANSLGLVTTILLLLRIGDVQRQGRALLLSQGIGAMVLASAAVAPSYLVCLPVSPFVSFLTCAVHLPVCIFLSSNPCFFFFLLSVCQTVYLFSYLLFSSTYLLFPVSACLSVLICLSLAYLSVCLV